MSKYIIELDDRIKLVTSVGVTENGVVYTTSDYVHNLEELNSDYINEHFGELQQDAYDRGYKDGRNVTETQAHDDAYQRGLDDAWETAKKILQMYDFTVFGLEHDGVFESPLNEGQQMTPQEAIEKLKAYEEKQDNKFEFGDEITNSYGAKGCVVSKDNEEGEMIYALFGGYRVPQHVAKSKYRKTGKHYDIEKILEALKA